MPNQKDEQSNANGEKRYQLHAEGAPPQEMQPPQVQQQQQAVAKRVAVRSNQALNREAEREYIRRAMQGDRTRASMGRGLGAQPDLVAAVENSLVRSSFRDRVLSINPVEIEENLPSALFCTADKAMAGFLLFILFGAICLTLFMFRLL